MASLNVAEWTPEQVAEWLSGLGPSVERYAAGLKARGLNGAKLLTLRCDDLEYLGVHIIGHQELLLEAVEHLRNFHYELKRECVQQLALRVSAAATALARTLRLHADARLETAVLADVARVVRAVKPLVCWLDRWPLCGGPALQERRQALLKLALEAATCAQRDRFAEQPARCVAASAHEAALAADYIVQDVCDPTVLLPASLDAVTLKQGEKPLGFEVVPSFCGHHQLAHIRFGSPAHASGAVHEGDEIVQVGDRCVVGWSGGAVLRACRAQAAGGADLPLRLRRRGAKAPSALPTPQLRVARPRRGPMPHPHLLLPRMLPEPILDVEETSPPLPCSPSAEAETSATTEAPPRASSPASSSGSEPLSPPASPTQLHPDHTRMYPPKPRAAPQRRHTISCGSPIARRPNLGIEQFWRELKEQQCVLGGGSGDHSPASSPALYRRDKALSCSTGLELSPRPRTCLAALASPGDKSRGKLDKSHSTPAYDSDVPIDEPGPLAAQTIPESPTTPTDSPTILIHAPEKEPHIIDPWQPRIHDEAINPVLINRVDTTPVEAVNVAPLPRRRPPSPPPRPSRVPDTPFPLLRAVPREPDPAEHKKEFSPLKPVRGAADPHISLPLRHLTKLDIRVVTSSDRNDLPAINADPEPPANANSPVHSHPTPPSDLSRSMSGLSPSSSAVRAIFPTSKSRSLKKKNSLLAKRRGVSLRALISMGGVGVEATGASGAEEGGGPEVWQRVRGPHDMRPRWAKRHLILAHNMLYAFRTTECTRATCMIYLEGWSVCAAGEVKSRAHAFKVYCVGSAFYFAAATKARQQAWIQLLQRATLQTSTAPALPDPSKQFSETEYSETDSEGEEGERREKDRDRHLAEREKDKSKFGSLKKLTTRMRSESQESVGQSAGAGAGAAAGAGASLDRKYLRFFSRHRAKDDKTHKSKQSGVPVPTEHYRSYRRVPDTPLAVSPLTPSSPSPPLPASPPDRPNKLPKPINYIHASNPNLVEFERSEFVGRPSLQPKPKVHKPETFQGFVTLEEFMLKKQEEERRQMYTNRVLMGIERDKLEERNNIVTKKAAKELQKRLDRIVPDVIYGELPPSHSGPVGLISRELPSAPSPPPQPATPRSPRLGPKPISIKGKDGYEKIVYPDELATEGGDAREGEACGSRRRNVIAPQMGPDKWRDSLRRNDKVHMSAATGDTQSNNETWSREGGVSRLRLMFGARARDAKQASPPLGGSGSPPGVERGVYPHLQCPPTFQPETYSLAARLHRKA